MARGEQLGALGHLASERGQEEDGDQPRAKQWMYAIGFVCFVIQITLVLTVYYFSNKKLEPLRTKAQKIQKKEQ
jgi:hypothetical protein